MIKKQDRENIKETRGKGGNIKKKNFTSLHYTSPDSQNAPILILCSLDGIVKRDRKIPNRNKTNDTSNVNKSNV